MTEKNKIALLTGVTGQVASHLADFLLYKGYTVVGLRRRTSTFNTERIEHLHNHPRFITEWGNMCDNHSLWRIIAKYKPDEIYNLAAQSHVRVSFDLPEESLDVNSKGFLNLLNAAKELHPKARIYQASTSEQYGDNPNIPQNEETRMTPASPYACSKLYSHHLARNYRESYGMFISCGIVFNTEGPRRGETFVTRKITQAAARIKLGLQNKLELGNLDAKRDWSYCPDTVEGIWLMLQQEKADDFALASGETHTVKEFLEETFKLANLKIDDHVSINPRFFRPQEVPILLGDSSKAKRVLGWEPKVKFKELVKIMYESDLKEQARLNNINLEKIK